MNSDNAMLTLIDLFNRFPDHWSRPAIIHRTGVRRVVTTYSELHDFSLRCAFFLEQLEIKPGDRVILWGPNSPAWVMAYWGIICRGAVAVPVDFMSGLERARAIASLTQAALSFQSRLKGESPLTPTSVFLEDLLFKLANCKPAGSPVAARDSDLVELVYTSGTTGAPKGVMLTHANLMANLSQVNEHVPVVTDKFSFLSVLPLSHMFEQMGGLLVPLSRGAVIVYLRTIKPSELQMAFRDEDIRAMILVPRILQMLRSTLERKLAVSGLTNLYHYLLSFASRLPPSARRILFLPIHHSFGRHFTLFVSGGAPLSADLARFWGTMGFRVLEGYGLTECSPVLTAATFDCQIPGAVGFPLPGVAIRLVDGEIQAQGANIFSGYYENQEATADTFMPDGWFRTGDLGELTPDGLLRIKGRSKELIVTGAGINVYPDEIEALFAKVPGVLEACVIGLDRGEGETVHAVIIPDGTGRAPEEIIADVNKRLDPLHSVTGVTIWPDADFPKTTTLKIQKFKVRQHLVSHHAPGGAAVTADNLITLIARITGCRADEIRDEAFLVADLGLTSISRLELITAVEQEYRLDLEDTLIGPQTRVSDLRKLIRLRVEPVTHGRRYRFWANSTPVRLFRQLCDIIINRPLFGLFVRLDVHGLNNLSSVEGPVFFVANHLSFLDQPSIMFALPRTRRYRTATAAWAEFFFVNFHTFWQRVWKRFTYEYGTFGLNLFPLPQSSGFRNSLIYMGRLADAGISILLFPEGERSQSGDMLPFRPGLGLMAQELKLPVIPIAICGIEKVLPRGGRFPRRGTVTVIFGAPLHFTTETPDEIVALTREQVALLRADYVRHGNVTD